MHIQIIQKKGNTVSYNSYTVDNLRKNKVRHKEEPNVLDITKKEIQHIRNKTVIDFLKRGVSINNIHKITKIRKHTIIRLAEKFFYAKRTGIDVSEIDDEDSLDSAIIEHLIQNNDISALVAVNCFVPSIRKKIKKSRLNISIN